MHLVTSDIKSDLFLNGGRLERKTGLPGRRVCYRALTVTQLTRQHVARLSSSAHFTNKGSETDRL